MEEGDRLKLTAKLKKDLAEGARVTLQRWSEAGKWEDVKTKPRGARAR